MKYHQQTVTLPEMQFEQEDASSSFLTQSHRNAVDRLDLSFTQNRPLAILIGDGQSAPRFIIGKFLSRIDQDVAVARIAEPCVNTTEFMGKIIRAFGFDPKDMSQEDLESVLSLFLSFQKSHRRRTIICIEEVQDCEWWVLDKIRSLVEVERDGGYGLMLILSGQSGVQELLHSRPLSSIAGHAGKRISIAPFTLPETREYIRRRVEAAGEANIDETFEFQSIPLIHELGGGVPDKISALISLCFRTADEEGVDLVTKELVQRAYALIGLTSEPGDVDTDAETLNATGLRPQIGRLIVQLTDDDVRELALRQSNILIGRSPLCDIRINSKFVSRHHALISHSPEGATIVDLGSTNGTTVDGYAITEHLLVPGETIVIGNCSIDYIIDGELQKQFQSAEQASSIKLNS